MYSVYVNVIQYFNQTKFWNKIFKTNLIADWKTSFCLDLPPHHFQIHCSLQISLNGGKKLQPHQNNTHQLQPACKHNLYEKCNKMCVYMYMLSLRCIFRIKKLIWVYQYINKRLNIIKAYNISTELFSIFLTMWD